MSTIAAFEHRPTAVREARTFVERELRHFDPRLVEMAVLLVSELATNAVVHTGSAFTVRIVLDSTLVRIEVTDSGAGAPTVRHPEPVSTNGRGLLIVQELAASWGVERSEDEKTVWFTLASDLAES